MFRFGQPQHSLAMLACSDPNTLERVWEESNYSSRHFFTYWTLGYIIKSFQVADIFSFSFYLYDPKNLGIWYHSVNNRCDLP